MYNTESSSKDCYVNKSNAESHPTALTASLHVQTYNSNKKHLFIKIHFKVSAVYKLDSAITVWPSYAWA